MTNTELLLQSLLQMKEEQKIQLKQTDKQIDRALKDIFAEQTGLKEGDLVSFKDRNNWVDGRIEKIALDSSVLTWYNIDIAKANKDGSIGGSIRKLFGSTRDVENTIKKRP